MRFTKHALLASIAASTLIPSLAHAQEADDGAEAEEIIVTARRQNERLVEVPASVSVIDADSLSKTGADNAQGFAQLTPGVTIVTGTAEAGDTQINIRGINGARDAESSVALVVDGILKTNTAQLNQTQGTLRQIEILKGPQGAIYGRNAAAGAIVISTVKPGDALEGAVKLSYANEKTIDGSAYIAGPLGDGVGFVLSGNYRTTDGFYRNLFLDRKVVDDQEVYSIDGRVIAQLGDATNLDLKARYSKLSGASINFNSVFHIEAFGGAFFEDVDDHPLRYYSNIRPTNDQRSIDFSAKLEHDFGSTKLTAWALYSDVDQSLTADGTSADFARYISPALGAPANATNLAVQNQCFATTAALTGFPVNPPGFIGQVPVPFIFAPATGSTFGAYSPTTCDGTQLQIRNQKDISGEIRLASNGDGPLNWQLGVYGLHIDRSVGVSLGADLGQGVSRELYNAPGSSNPTSQLFYDKFKTDVYAAFGSVDYEMSDRFKAGVALRYDVEDRSTTNLVPNVFDPITGAKINPGLPATGSIADKSAKFKQLQPKVTLSFTPNSSTNIYANWGVGFKSGGFNNTGSSALVNANFNIPEIGAGVTINDLFRKEKSSAFEAGIKGSLFDNRVTFDLAGYYTRITDMQFFEFFVGSFGLLRVVSNIDKVDVKGVELNTAAKIVDGWKVFGSVNITDSEIKANASRPYTVGNKSPYTADYTINLGTQIDAPLSNTMDLVLRADYRITGPTWFHTVQNQTRATIFSQLLPISALALPGFVGNANYSVAKRNAFGVLNLRFGLEGENWNLTAFADNMLDRKYINEAIPAIEFGGSFISPGARRLIGVEAGYKF
ncbi:TonB-dependent receptor [Sphingorhabdus sp.]|jgi:iron complex outermembrane receptor protein|uniref:TonB-dependent receptor n=1 Tax=Sphingorhabdus sp. TaxID=1902408 RepID=UPI002D130C54|nr:TonB-dependent receptor [Sphingorhabdus sp.]HMT41929.1 TonB-dependent receptor [Sphingorhabdus sp.]